jgi:hypothetical protein
MPIEYMAWEKWSKILEKKQLYFDLQHNVLQCEQQFDTVYTWLNAVPMSKGFRVAST